MTPPFSSQDLGRIFDARTITRGRSLGLTGQVEVQLEGDTITAVVQDSGVELNVRITPSLLGRRVVFDHRCTCRIPGCAHLAAGALAALDRFPSLRKPEQQTFLDLLAAAPEQERQRTVFELATGVAPYACVVSTLLVRERTGAAASTTPRRIAADVGANRAVRELARLLGNSNEGRRGAVGTRAERAGSMACWRPTSQARRDSGILLPVGGSLAAPLRGDRRRDRTVVRRCHHWRGWAGPCAAAGRGTAIADARASRTAAAPD
jgi:hypothetical protein